MKKLQLQDFREFLRSRRLVNEKYIPFYAQWARKLLSFSDKSKRLGHDLRIEAFLNHLRSQDNIADRQIKQDLIPVLSTLLPFFVNLRQSHPWITALPKIALRITKDVV
jgi:hypothetical protein